MAQSKGDGVRKAGPHRIVADGGDQGSSTNSSAGVSSSDLIRWTNVAASHPSTMRWSKLDDRLNIWRGSNAAVAPHRTGLHLVDADDRDLGRVDDRRGGEPAERPERRDRDRRTGQLVARRRSVTGGSRRPVRSRRRDPRCRAPRRGGRRGRSSPSSVWVAMPMWTASKVVSVSVGVVVVGVEAAAVRRRRSTIARTRNGRIVSRTPRVARCGAFSSARSRSSSVTSIAST